MYELKFNQNMFNHQMGIITTEVDYGTFTELRDRHTFVGMRSEHTGDLRIFHFQDKGIIEELDEDNKLYYYNEDMDVYLRVMTKIL